MSLFAEIHPVSISADWKKESRAYKVISIYRRVINLVDENSLHCTLITDKEDFSTRSALVKRVPEVQIGDTVNIITDNATIDYDPFLQVGQINDRWLPLISEWKDFLKEDGLEVILEKWDGNHSFPLLGLGPGSTPAGDDFLHGRFAAHFRCFSIEDVVVKDFKKCYRPGSTVRLSENFYRDLFLRKIWRRGNLLLEALEGDDHQKVLDAVNKLIQWGHSSGLAWLAGFAYGVEEIKNNKRR